jgi:hypothetical protein
MSQPKLPPDLLDRAFARVGSNRVLEMYRNKQGLVIEVVPGQEPHLCIMRHSGEILGMLDSKEMHRLAGLIYSAMRSKL